MLGLLVIVLTFVFLGLAVVALAMRSGPKGAPRPKGETRIAFLCAGVVTVAFGLGIPALVLAYNAGSQSKGASGGIELTAAQQEGREIFAKNCSTCHVLGAANAVGRVGPSLDAIIPAIADKKARIAFTDDAVINGRARGKGQMPKGLVDGTDRAKVSEFVAVAAGR